MCTCSAITRKVPRIRHVTHCIFDLDGTLLNSEVIFQKMVKEACAKNGAVYPDELRQQLYGTGRRKLCEILIKKLGMTVTTQQLEAQIAEMAASRLPKAPLQKGALRLVDHLISHEIPIAIATNCTRVDLDNYMNARPIFFSKFHHAVCINDVPLNHGKPNPDLYLLAAAKFEDKPKSSLCLVFEDTATGLQAAVAAKMQVVLTPHTGVDRKYAKQATQVLNSLLEFKPEMFGLPSFNVPGLCRPITCRTYKHPHYWAEHLDEDDK